MKSTPHDRLGQSVMHLRANKETRAEQMNTPLTFKKLNPNSGFASSQIQMGKDIHFQNSILDFVDVKLDKMPRRRSIIQEGTKDQLKKYGKSSQDQKANQIEKHRTKLNETQSRIQNRQNQY